MKKHTIGIFAAREDAEKAINYIHNKLKVGDEEISYLYRNDEGQVKEVDASEVSSATPREGAGKEARAGAWIGALAGAAVVAGVLPVAGPFFAAGPLLASIGVTGAVGTAAAGAIGGAAVGGLIGALVNIGVGEEKAKRYEDQVIAGNILVAVHADQGVDVESAMREHNALEVDSYMVKV